MDAEDANNSYPRATDKDKNRRLLDAVDQYYALLVVDFSKADFNDFGVAGLHGAADILSFDGHFTVAAVDQHAEGNALGPAKVEQTVHRGAYGAASVKDIIDKDKVKAVDTKGDVGGLQHGLRGHLGQVVAVESDVERADRDLDTVNAAHGAGNALCERHAATADADQGQAAGAATFFDDLVRQALQGAVDFGSRHQLRFFNDSHSRVMLAQVEDAGTAPGT